MATVLQPSDGIVSFDILTNGKKIKDVVEIIEISVTTEVNRITSATIVMQDGGAIGVDNADFVNSESDDFIPGNKIEISMGYNNTREKVFSGIIVSQNLIVKNSISQLIIICKDEAIKMTKGRINSIFQEMKDSDAISKIAGKYGLQATVDSTTFQNPVLMQYNSSDWDFVVIRAEINNMLVLTDKNKLVVKKYDFSSSPKFTIEASQFIIDIDISLDSGNVTDKFNLTAWSEAEQKETKTSVSISGDTAQGNINAKKLSEVVNSKGSNHYSSTSLTTDELKIWGEAMAIKGVLSKIQGKISVPGTAGIIAGDMIQLSGFSDRFNGNAFISKVEQKMEVGSWVTTLNVGRSKQWHSSLPDVEDTLASGLIPAANGTQIAKVKKIHEDPEGNYRVLVTLPVFSGDGESDGIWARMAFPYASADAGFFFFPEVDDEVLLTFVNNDPRFPVITGSLYSTKNKPKETPDDKNQFKSIYSKSGINIRFDDEDKILVIETPGGNSFTMDDKDKKINIKDITGNSVLMDNSGITMNSPKDIKLKADGNVDITATGGINMKATSDLKAEGMNIQMSANTGFTAKGNASAEISASGQTTVKGAMVMIN